MASYLTAVVPHHLEGSFREWLAPHLPVSGAEEHLVLDLPGTTARLHHVARDAHRDSVDLSRRSGAPAGARPSALPSAAPDAEPGEAPVRGAVFHGFAHSADEASTVFGAPGLAAAHADGHGGLLDAPTGEEWEGSYALLTWNGRQLSAHTDLFRQLPMMVTGGGGLLAVSDSWQVLIRLRSALGLSVTVTGELAAALTLDRVIGSHPVDTGTLCAEVRMVGVGARLSATLGPEGVTGHRLEQVPFPTVFAGRRGTWAEQVRFGAISMASILRSLVDSGLQLRLSLSGGADSRAVLAALRLVDPHQEVTTLTTSNRGAANARDAEVVDGLAEALGLTLGAQPDRPARVERYPTPFQAWMVGTLGLHDRLGMPRSRALPGSHYTLTGHGAGTYKSTFGWRPFVEVSAGLERFDPAAGPLVARRAEDYLRSVGADPEAPGSSEWHFIAWRNSLHGGRSTLVNLLSDPLLMQRGLTSLAHADPGSASAMPEALRAATDSNAPRPNTSLTHVLMALLDPELALLPFDRKDKDLDPQTLEAILAAAGGVVTEDDLVPIRGYGVPEDVQSGIAETFLALAEHWGQGVAMEHEAIRPLMEQGYRIAADLGLDGWYAPVLERARRDLDDPGTLTQKDGPVAKLLAFLPLADATVDGPVPVRPVVAAPPAAGARDDAPTGGNVRTRSRWSGFPRRAVGRSLRWCARRLGRLRRG